MTQNFKSDGTFTAGTASCAGFYVASFLSLVSFPVKTQSSEHFKINSISELIIKKSRLNMKLLKLFNGTAIFISYKSSSPSGNVPTDLVL